ncbi:MAG: FAD-dependent oxidoreductase, partial [Cyanobacteria bacterium J06648_11]
DIDIVDRHVKLADGSALAYDYLVIGLGGDTAFYNVPGAADHSLPFRDLSHARALQKQLETWTSTEALGHALTLAIAGAGPSGVELACKLADTLGDRADIHLIDRGDEILASFQSESRTAARKALSDRGVCLHLNSTVLEVGADFVRFQTSQVETMLPAIATLWTAGSTVAPVVQKLPLAKNDLHQLDILPTLQTRDRPEIFALGDNAVGVDAEGNAIPATAQAAFQQASYCAWNVWALATASEKRSPRPLLPFRYLALGEMLSLGADNASLSGLGLSLDGPLGYVARRLVYLARLPSVEHQLRVGWHWMTQPLTQSLSQFWPQTTTESDR